MDILDLPADFLALLAVVSLGFALRDFFRPVTAHERFGAQWILLTAGFGLTAMAFREAFVPHREKPAELIRALFGSGLFCFVFCAVWTLIIKASRRRR